MDVKVLLKRQLPVLGIFAPLFTLGTLALHGGICFEGGTIIGFPWMFYSQCYGPFLPGGGQIVDPAQFVLLGLVLDVAFWYLVSAALVYGIRSAVKRSVSREL